MDYAILQEYWWLLISVLGGALVALLFVQGGQTMLFQIPAGQRRDAVVSILGHKWEITFTTLVMFGGALFASFPLFYSTSFGGAYWLWILILFSFVIQAVSYEFRRRQGNVYGQGTYDTFLFINGTVGCLLLGVAVAMFYFGGEFTVVRGNLVDASAPVISRWAPSHGFEAICQWRNLLLGFTVIFLARTLGCLYIIQQMGADDAETMGRMRRHVLINGAIFVVLFLWFMAALCMATGYSYDTVTGFITAEPYKYLHNYLQMWWAWSVLVIGVLAVLYGVCGTVGYRAWRHGFWWTAGGVFLVVCTLFWVSGYNNTAFYPSLIDAQSSLTIRNASSSQFTLGVMAWVSLIIPIVIAYIAYVWNKMGHR